MLKLKNLLPILILGITDAYLISHPNIIGRLGVFVYKYSMIKNFPSALITVFVTLAICIAVAAVIEANKDHKWARYLLIACTVLSIFILVQVILKFTGGTYAHTGKSFIWGMILLPTNMLYVFGTVWYSKSNSKVTSSEKLL